MNEFIVERVQQNGSFGHIIVSKTTRWRVKGTKFYYDSKREEAQEMCDLLNMVFNAGRTIGALPL